MANYKPSREVLIAMIKQDEADLVRLKVAEVEARQAAQLLAAQIALYREALQRYDGHD
jgi:hypothetical protein